MLKFAKAQLSLLVAVALGSGFVGVMFGRQLEYNGQCCLIPRGRRVVLTAKEILGLATFHSENDQDKWVSEAIFPDVKNGFFLDVGSADGTLFSSTKALEQKGWSGICIDPFPKNMQDRTCQMFKEVVFSEAGKRVTAANISTAWKDQALKAPTVEFTAVTLGDILARARAPQFIHFVSLDIGGAEFEALKGFPFDKYRIGALAVEHNYEEPRRSEIEALMKSHGYKLAHRWRQDDFYLPEHRASALP